MLLEFHCAFSALKPCPQVIAGCLSLTSWEPQSEGLCRGVDYRTGWSWLQLPPLVGNPPATLEDVGRHKKDFLELCPHQAGKESSRS